MLGGQIWSRINHKIPLHADVVTANILIKDNSEILQILQSDELLVAAINEAVQNGSLPPTASQVPQCINLELHALLHKGTSVVEDEPPQFCVIASRVASSVDLSKDSVGSCVAFAQAGHRGPIHVASAPPDKATPSTQEYPEHVDAVVGLIPHQEEIAIEEAISANNQQAAAGDVPQNS